MKVTDIKLCLKNNDFLHSVTNIECRGAVECEKANRVQVTKAVIDWFFQTCSEIIKDHQWSKRDILVIDYMEVYD